MATIVFEYTRRSIYASQGSGPSAMEGYDIWSRNPDGFMDFLGFCKIAELESNVSLYQNQGDIVHVRKQVS